jgi:hypothetical protein
MGGQMLGAGGRDGRLIHGDDGTVGMGHQTVVARGVDSGSGRSGGVYTAVDGAVSGQMFCAGGDHSGLVSGHHSSVGMGHQLRIMDGAGVGGRIDGRGGSSD